MRIREQAIKLKWTTRPFQPHFRNNPFLEPLSGKIDMIVIIGSIVVIGAVLGGFVLSGGQVGALVHPTEILTIGGAALGALIIMSPVKVLKDLMKGVLSTLKGSPFSKEAYDELFKVLYEFLRLARQDGLIALEPHLANPHESSIFHKYPLIGNNHHVSDFICGAFSPAVEGSATPEQLEALLEIDLKTIEEEHHGPLGVLIENGRRIAGLRHRRGRAGDRDHDGRDRRAGERNRRKGRRRAGRHVSRNSGVVRIHRAAGRADGKHGRTRSWRSSARFRRWCWRS